MNLPFETYGHEKKKRINTELLKSDLRSLGQKARSGAATIGERVYGVGKKVGGAIQKYQQEGPMRRQRRVKELREEVQIASLENKLSRMRKTSQPDFFGMTNNWDMGYGSSESKRRKRR